MTNIYTISSFPEDNLVRVLYRYGGIQKNNSGISISPHIQVLLVELDKTGKLITKNFLCTYVKLNELHKANLGSVWKGQSLLSNDFNIANQIRQKEFTLYLENSRPLNVNFDYVKKQFQKIKSNVEILNYLNYPNIEIIDENIKKKLANFDKANYVQITSTKDIDVFISSIDVLNSLFINNIKIKEKLISAPIINIVDEYLESYESLSSTQCLYKIKIKNNKKKLSKPAIRFLAFLALNKEVQNKVSLLQYSLEETEYIPYNYQNIERFPIILPPQPNKLKIKTKGLWYKEYFFVIEIESVKSTYNYVIFEDEND